MKPASITLTKQQRIWLKDLILADIHDWEYMSSRPVSEVGVMFPHLAETRIRNMRTILAKLDIHEAIETLENVHKSGLVPDMVSASANGLSVVINRD